MKYDEPEDIWADIQVCPIHPQGTQMRSREEWEECLGCQAEAVARGAVIDQMGAEGMERMKGLAAQGFQGIPPWDLLAIRLDVLCESIFSPRDRLRFEGEVGRRTLLLIKDIQRQAKKPTLHVAREGAVQDIRKR